MPRKREWRHVSREREEICKEREREGRHARKESQKTCEGREKGHM